MADTKMTDAQLPRFLEDALKKALAHEYDFYAKEAVKKFEEDMTRRRDAVIAGVMLNVTRNMSFKDLNDRLVVEIIKLDKQA